MNFLTKNKALIWVAVLLLIIVRLLVFEPKYYNRDRVQISARVLTDPVRNSYQDRIFLPPFYFYLPKYPEIKYGDRITVEGIVEVKNSRWGKSYWLNQAKLIQLKPNLSPLFLFRHKLADFYFRFLPEPHASLVAGMSLGIKTSIPDWFWLKLTKTGTAHVVVASGMNVSLVAGFLLPILLIFVKRRYAAPIIIVMIWIYAMLVGIEAPIVRAAIMGSIAFFAQSLGRLYEAKKGLITAGLIMVVVKPEWIADAGFWLSFMATLSILYLEKPVFRLLGVIPSFLRQGLATSVAAQVGVAPILFFAFGRASLLSPFINLLVLWTVPIISIVGIGSAFLGLIIPFLGRIGLWLIYPLTSWFIWVAESFGS